MKSRVQNDLSAIHKLNQKLTKPSKISKEALFKSKASQGKSLERTNNQNNLKSSLHNRFHSPNISFKSYENQIKLGYQSEYKVNNSQNDDDGKYDDLEFYKSEKVENIVITAQRSPQTISDSSLNNTLSPYSPNQVASKKSLIQNMLSQELYEKNEEVFFIKKNNDIEEEDDVTEIDEIYDDVGNFRKNEYVNTLGNEEDSKDAITRKLKEIYEENEKIIRTKKNKILKSSFKEEIEENQNNNVEKLQPKIMKKSNDSNPLEITNITTNSIKLKTSSPKYEISTPVDKNSRQTQMLEQQERTEILSETPPEPKERSRSRRKNISKDEKRRSRSGSIKKMVKNTSSFLGTKKTRTPNTSFTNILKKRSNYSDNLKSIKKKRIDLREEKEKSKSRLDITKKKKDNENKNKSSTPNSYSRAHNKKITINTQNNIKNKRNGGRSKTPVKTSFESNINKMRSFRSNSKKDNEPWNLKKIKSNGKDNTSRRNIPAVKGLIARKKISKSKKKLASFISKENEINKRDASLAELEEEEEDKKRKIKKLSKSESLEKLKEFNKKVNLERKKHKRKASKDSNSSKLVSGYDEKDDQIEKLKLFNSEISLKCHELEQELTLITSHLSEIGFHEDLQNPETSDKSEFKKRKELALKPSKKIKILIEATKKLKLAFDDVVLQKSELENSLNDSNTQVKTLEMLMEELKTTNKNLQQEIITLTKFKEKGVLSPEQVSKMFNDSNNTSDYKNKRKKRNIKRKSQEEEKLVDLLAINKIHSNSIDNEDGYKGKTYFTYNNEDDLIQKDEDYIEENYEDQEYLNQETDWGIGIVPEVGRASLETTERHRTQKETREGDVINVNNFEDDLDSAEKAYLRGSASQFNNGSAVSRHKVSEYRMTDTSLNANFKEGIDGFIDFTKKVSTRSYNSAESPGKLMDSDRFKKKGHEENLTSPQERSSWNKIRNHNDEKLRSLQVKRNQVIKILMMRNNGGNVIMEEEGEKFYNVETVKFVNSTFREYEELNKELMTELKTQKNKINLLENHIELLIRKTKINEDTGKNPKEEKIEEGKMEEIPEEAEGGSEEYKTPPTQKEKTVTDSSIKRQRNYIQTLEIERLEIENRWKKERIKVRELKRELKLLYSKRGQELKKDLEKEMGMYNSGKFSNGGGSQQKKIDMMKFSYSSPPSDHNSQVGNYHSNSTVIGGNGQFVTPPSKTLDYKRNIDVLAFEEEMGIRDKNLAQKVSLYL